MYIESGHVLKDPVAGDEFEFQRDGSRRDPAVGFVDLVGQPMSGPGRGGTQARALVDEPLVGLDYLDVTEGPLQLAAAKLTPAGPDRAVAQLGDSDEGNDSRSVADGTTSLLGVTRRPRVKKPAGNVGVDDDVSEPSGDHASASTT